MIKLWDAVAVASVAKFTLPLMVLGNPLRFTLTGGHRHDITHAYDLLEGFDFERLIADRGYSAEHFVEYLLDQVLKL